MCANMAWFLLLGIIKDFLQLPPHVLEARISKQQSSPN